MFKHFTTKELIFTALSGAFVFTVAFALGAALLAVTGTPMVGGIIVNLFVSFILVSAALVVRKFGILTAVLFIHTLLSTPTINFGPPGAYKILIGITIGLLIDIIIYFANYKKWAYYFGAGLGFLIAVPYMVLFLKLLDMPALGRLLPLMYPLMGIYLVEALLGTYLAIKFYDKKLKHLRIIQQIAN
jgi:hypothetical protein